MNIENKYRTFEESQEEYYRNHPEEIEGYLVIAFEEYAKDKCTPALLSQLRMIARVKGLSVLAEETDVPYDDIQEAFTERENPKLESVNTIMNALGYCLTPKKIDIQSEELNQKSVWYEHD